MHFIFCKWTSASDFLHLYVHGLRLLPDGASSSISSWVRFSTSVITFYLFLLRRHNSRCWRHRRSWAIFTIRRIGWVSDLRITEYSFDLRNLCLSFLNVLSIFSLSNAFGIERVSCCQSRGADSLDIITSNFNCILTRFFLCGHQTCLHCQDLDSDAHDARARKDICNASYVKNNKASGFISVMLNLIQDDPAFTKRHKQNERLQHGDHVDVVVVAHGEAKRIQRQASATIGSLGSLELRMQNEELIVWWKA